MAVSLGQQISALKTQRNLTEHTEALGRSYERLSTGMRINKGSDDAAGLSIAESLNTDKRITLQALRNANDGLSATRIMDSALGELVNITTRISELAEQSANGVYSATQRAALNTEATKLSEEYNRIIETTTFNNRNLFDSADGELRIQVGTGVNNSLAMENISIPGTLDFSGTGGAAASGGAGIESTTGDGTFTALAPIVFGEGVLAVGDINGDGKVDAAACTGGAEIYLALGNGDGTFNTPYTVNGSDRHNGISLTDLNNDGKVDMIATYRDVTKGVDVFMGNGDGTFQAAAATSLTQTSGLVVADVSGDGIKDIITGSPEGNNAVRVLKGNGNGTFQAATTFTVATGPTAIAVGDLNSDGKMDIVTANSDSGGVSVLIGSGGGNFNAAVNYGGPAAYFLSLGDVTGDGNLDVLIGENSDQFSLRVGNGDGTFQARTVFSGSVGSFPTVTAGDLNGDGKADLVLNNTDNEVMRVYTSDGSTLNLSESFTLWDGNPAVIADVNNDSVQDILITDQWGHLNVFTQDTVTTPDPDPGGGTGDSSAIIVNGDLTTSSAASQTLDSVRSLQDSLISTRGRIGAFESRLSVAISNLQSKSVVTSEAESRIRDIDVASEVAELTKNNIRSQIASNILKMSTLNSQVALDLLRG